MLTSLQQANVERLTKAPMAEIKFEIEGPHGAVSVDTFYRAIHNAIQLLREFDSAISHLRRGSLRWYVLDLHSNGTLALNVRSKLRPPIERRKYPDNSALVANSFVRGFDDLENRTITPAYLSEAGMAKAQELVSLIGQNGARGFRVSTQQQSVDITSATFDSINKLLPIRRTAVGSIEGTLEKISIHKRPQFIVYHAISKKAVTCEFDQPDFLQTVKDALGRRVTVFGTLFKNFKGETRRIQVDRIRVRDEKQSSLLQLSDSSDAEIAHELTDEPEFTDAKDSAEMLRRIRGG